MFLRILNDAVESIPIEYKYAGTGRPHFRVQDMIKCCCIKVFNCFSSRRTIPDLQLAYIMGFISQTPHFNSIINYMNDPQITQYLHQVYRKMAEPLVPFESVFAIDATGFTTLTKKSWVDTTYKKSDRFREFRKLHIVTGVKTNVITEAEATDCWVGDINCFPDLVKRTAMKFKMKEILADSAYFSKKNIILTEELKTTPYITCNIGFDKLKAKGICATWDQMINLWKTNQEFFLEHYHKRSNVESTFSMIKRKFLAHVRSKKLTAQTNEMLCKVICHNGSVLVNSIFELDADVKFLENM
jgi:transposase